MMESRGLRPTHDDDDDEDVIYAEAKPNGHIG